MTNREGKTLRETATDLERIVGHIRSRLGDVRVLGWSGFNVDLDEAEKLIQRLREQSRGAK